MRSNGKREAQFCEWARLNDLGIPINEIESELPMIIILFPCMLIVPWVIGNGVLCILYRKAPEGEFTACDALLTGWIAVTGVAEAVHLAAVFGHLPLSLCTILFSVLTVSMTLVSLVIWLLSRIRKKQESGKRSFDKPTLLFLLPVALLLSQLAYIVLSGGVYLSRDMTLETVLSFLSTNGIYQVNPMTGAAYEAGIPLRIEILCLPTLYSVLSRIFRVEARTVVWMAVPCVTLICSYSAFHCVGRSLFPESVKRRECFLAVIALLLWAGSYVFGMDGFDVLYSGFRGVTIRNAVLIPYLFSLCIRRKWKLAVLCIAAEACLVWTLYGMGACLLTAAVYLVCRLLWHRLDKIGGKEAAQ